MKILKNFKKCIISGIIFLLLWALYLPIAVANDDEIIIFERFLLVPGFVLFLYGLFGYFSDYIVSSLRRIDNSELGNDETDEKLHDDGNGKRENGRLE